MLIIPAIDLEKSKVVRLYKGNFEKVTFYKDDPVELVKEFIIKGAKRIHVICLLGAKDGKIHKEDEETIQKIIKERNVFTSKCEIQLGGGIRRIEEIEYFLNLGIDHLIVSTGLILPVIIESGFSLGDIKLFYQKGGKEFNMEMELPQFNLAEKIDKNIKNKIIIGIDCYENQIALSGWQAIVPLKPSYLINKLIKDGFKQFILTDIARDGTMEGPDINGLETVFNEIADIYKKSADKNFIVGGGIRNQEDIQNLYESGLPIFGVVIGKALYESSFDLKQTIIRFQ